MNNRDPSGHYYWCQATINGTTYSHAPPCDDSNHQIWIPDSGGTSTGGSSDTGSSSGGSSSTGSSAGSSGGGYIPSPPPPSPAEVYQSHTSYLSSMYGSPTNTSWSGMPDGVLNADANSMSGTTTADSAILSDLGGGSYWNSYGSSSSYSSSYEPPTQSHIIKNALQSYSGTSAATSGQNQSIITSMGKGLLHGVVSVSKYAYNTLAGDDIHTLRSQNAKWYQKALAGADLALNFVPGEGAVKIGAEFAAKSAFKLVAGETAKKVGSQVASKIKNIFGLFRKKPSVAAVTSNGSSYRLKMNLQLFASEGTGKGVQPYEVGRYNTLSNKSLPNDSIEIHHAAQKHPANQVIPGYDGKTAPSIALPRSEHRAIPTHKGGYTGNPRDLLTKDIWDLRNYTNAPNSALKDLIQENKSAYPNAFQKP